MKRPLSAKHLLLVVWRKQLGEGVEGDENQVEPPAELKLTHVHLVEVCRFFT